MVIALKDNRTRAFRAPSAGESAAEWEAFVAARPSLERFNGKTLEELSQAGLLVFPRDLKAHGDEIGKSVVYTLMNDTLTTGNIVGFLGWDKVRMSIQSRFDHDERQFFLHYMLQKVFGLHVVDLKTTTLQESLWDFLPYLFPYCLKQALRQGLYRTYRTFHFNDDRVRGTVNVSEFIRRNMPFRGQVAYSTREHTANNPLFHLIRHTIEVLRASKLFASVLNMDAETQECVRMAMAVTSDFSPGDRNKVILQNLRGVNHPYYTEYTALQKLCLQILRHEKLAYGNEDREIHGILFDAAWLWEEYLNVVMAPLKLTHPRNRRGAERRYLFTGAKGFIYPDFLAEDRLLVLDAKYKHLENGNLPREDQFQLIAYLHVLWEAEVAREATGLLLYPAEGETRWEPEGNLRGCGGALGRVGLRIPPAGKDFADFKGRIQAEEARFLQALQRAMGRKFYTVGGDLV